MNLWIIIHSSEFRTLYAVEICILLFIFFYNIDCAFLNDDICKYLLDTSILHQEHFNIATDIKKTKWLSAADVDACLLPAVCYDSIIIAYDKIDWSYARWASSTHWKGLCNSLNYVVLEIFHIPFMRP